MEIYNFLSFIALKVEGKCDSVVQLVEGSSRGRHRRGNRAAAEIFLDIVAFISSPPLTVRLKEGALKG